MNKLGVKWALVIGSMSFPIEGSAYYCNSKFGNQWVSQQILHTSEIELTYVCFFSILFLVVQLVV